MSETKDKGKKIVLVGDKRSPETARLLRLRSVSREAKPEFARQSSWRYKRVKNRWRAPRGIDSMMRYKEKAVPKQPSTGYGSPRKIRGHHPSGLEETAVWNVKDLEKIDAAKQAARIAHTVSKRKRPGIIEKAKELGIRILNPKEVKELEPKDSKKIGI